MLLVYGPRSATYDFGPGHPLTPRRFGPGIDLLRAVGAEPGLAPEPAIDEDLLRCHTRRYLSVVKRFSEAPYGFGEAGIGEGGDDPPFAGMHDAAAAVAGGSLRAIEAVLRGDVEHAQHPGGGLHHAMAERASGFCIYDDVALAIARARADGLRVLYLDLDVHHGDGVQAIHWDDPGVLTVSIHEVAARCSSRAPAPRTRSGRGPRPARRSTSRAGRDRGAGLDRHRPPALPGARRGVRCRTSSCPSTARTRTAWDPLAHLHTTTTVMGEAARLVDAIAHRHAGGRWLATGGGGYDAYRVVPRAWALTWLAGAHREVPAETPAAWRERWAGEGARYGQAPLPTTFDDPELDAELGEDWTTSTGGRWHPARSSDACWCRGCSARRSTGAGTTRWRRRRHRRRCRRPRSRRRATRRSWPSVDPATWAGLTLAPRVVAPADAPDAHALIAAALADDGSGARDRGGPGHDRRRARGQRDRGGRSRAAGGRRRPGLAWPWPGDGPAGRRATARRAPRSPSPNATSSSRCRWRPGRPSPGGC